MALSAQSIALRGSVFVAKLSHERALDAVESFVAGSRDFKTLQVAHEG